MRSTSEIENDYKSRFGDEEGRRYIIIRDGWATLWCLWDDYQELFLGTQARLDVLNGSAITFFYMYRNIAEHALLLGVARLTDIDSRTCSIHNFVKNFVRNDPAIAVEVFGEINSLLEDAVTKSDFSRGWRNQIIAHRDLDPSGVQPFNVQQIETAIDAIHALIAKVEQVYLETHLVNTVLSPPVGALSLLYCLRDGLEAEEYRKLLQKSGKLTWQQLAPKPI